MKKNTLSKFECVIILIMTFISCILMSCTPIDDESLVLSFTGMFMLVIISGYLLYKILKERRD